MEYISFSEVLAGLLERFNIEKAAKNQAYDFILTNGLLPQYVEFSKTHKPTTPIEMVMKNTTI